MGKFWGSTCGLFSRVHANIYNIHKQHIKLPKEILNIKQYGFVQNLFFVFFAKNHMKSDVYNPHPFEIQLMHLSLNYHILHHSGCDETEKIRIKRTLCTVNKVF